MATTTNTLLLTDPQQETIQEMGIELDSIYVIPRDSLNDAVVHIDGYTNGHTVFFLSGNSMQHANFLRYLYGENYQPLLITKFRGITAYGSPTQRFVGADYAVSVKTNANNTINY